MADFLARKGNFAQDCNMLNLFVYGSLKRSEQNFARYCSGFTHAHDASVVGRLYRQADGYPMLVVPQTHLIGTSDRAADVALLQDHHREHPCQAPALPQGDWQWISGDLFQYQGESSRAFAPVGPAGRFLSWPGVAISPHDHRRTKRTRSLLGLGVCCSPRRATRWCDADEKQLAQLAAGGGRISCIGRSFRHISAVFVPSRVAARRWFT